MPSRRPSRRSPRNGGLSSIKRLVSISLTAIVALLPIPALAASEQPWEFDGGGWGHGIGMSQFGALGQAEDNRTVDQILAFYYTGSSTASMPVDHWTRQDEGLLIGLASNTGSVKIEIPDGPVVACQPSDCSDLVQPLNNGEVWFFETDAEDPTMCRFRHQGVDTGYRPCDAKVDGLTTISRVEIEGREYARGSIRFDPSADGFHAVVAVGLEEYLYGLAEVPSSWDSKALQVQAIAGRSYAVATAIDRGGDDGKKTMSSCGCHLLPSTLDQAYVGWSKEDPANDGARWKDAVDATSRKVVTHPESGKPFNVVKTFYSSSNGGASENNEDVWGGSALPWLRSVVDPWSADPNVNPLASWTIHVDDGALADYLGWDRALDAFVLEGPPGVLVEFTGKNGDLDVATILNGTQIRTLLNTIGVHPDGGSVRVSPYISAVIDPPGFDDIVGHLFEADIDWALAENITKGCNPPANTMFCPDDEVSREVMAAFLNRYLDLPAATKDHFSDDNGSIFEDDINRLAEAGITKGCGGTKFCPHNVVDRGQMAAFLVRAFGLKGDGGGDLFIDDDGSIFEHDIDILGNAEITRGCNPPTNDRYCPDLAVDRGAMTAFLHRAPVP